ncbi:MAG: Fic family protein [Eggerthellaceae bacterium]|nr:Fic family protein [Eggerthellaceae bacterium]
MHLTCNHEQRAYTRMRRPSYWPRDPPPPSPRKIRPAMDGLLCEYKALAENSHPLLAIARFHAAFESIHPSADGNGRTGRLHMNFQLREKAAPPHCHKGRPRLGVQNLP